MSIFDDLVSQPSEKDPAPAPVDPRFTDQAALLSNLAHVPADLAGFVGDALTEGAKGALNIAKHGMQGPQPEDFSKNHLPGFGEASKIFQKLTDKVVPRQPASNPVTQGASDFAEMAAALAAGGGEATLPQLLKTAAGVYGGSKLADRFFPGNELAQFAGGLAGGVAPHILEGGIRSAASARNIVNGASHPDFPTLVSMVQDREGGGTYANPKVNLKSGAMGPMQVTPETARQPGYGIRPWDGKSQEDLARVGTQKLAALMTKYGGDTQKAFAAYNWGEGHVDHAVATYGDNWVAHAPAETQKYIKGVSGPATPVVHPEDLGQPSIVAEEQPSTADQALTNALLSPHEAEPEGLTPDQLRERSRQEVSGKVTYLPDRLAASEENLPPKVNRTPYQQGEIDRLANALQDHADKNNMSPETVVNYLERLPDDHPFVKELQDRVDSSPIVPRDPNDERVQGTLTPAEAQEMDASAPKPLVDGSMPNPRYMSPPEAANDSNSPSFRQSFLNMLKDDSGALDLGKIFGQRKKPYGEAGPDGNGYEGLDTNEKLQKDIRSLRPANAEQVAANRQARGAKFAQVEKIQQELGGMEGLKQSAAVLRGQLPKVTYESISHHYSPEEKEALINQVNSSRTLRTAEKFKASKALAAMLDEQGTKLPTRSDLKLLSKVLHDQTVEALNAKVLAPDHVGLLEKLWNTVNAAKTIGDWSDLTKSNATMFLTPGYWKTLGNFVRGGFFGKGSYQNIRNATRANPDYDLVKQMGISHTGKGEAMNQHEEIFRTNLLEHVPGLSHVMDASERVYSGVANEVRDHAALKMIAKDRKAGIDVEDPAYLKQAGELINTLTGRASFGRSKLGVAVERGMPFISKVLWTPRQYASWVKMAGYAANPKFWINASPAMRTQLATGFLSLTAWTASNLAIASSLGYEVHKNILDPLFGKYKIGDTIYDASAGRGSTLHAIASAISGNVLKDGQVQNLGDNSHAWLRTRGDVVMHWARTHASPAAALIENEYEGKDLQHPVNAVGVKQDWSKWKNIEENPMLSAMIPMSAEGTVEAGQHYGWNNRQTYETGVGEMFGRQANTQEPRPAKAGKKGGDPFDNLVTPNTGNDSFDKLVNPKASQDIFNKLVSK